MSDDAKPFPKSAQLARGNRRYRRKIASAKQWQAIIAAKLGPCRGCSQPTSNGGGFPKVQFHHVVRREDGGDDVADNIIPLCFDCHRYIHGEGSNLVVKMTRIGTLSRLTDAEYAYMIERGGEGYPERAYGIVYSR